MFAMALQKETEAKLSGIDNTLPWLTPENRNIAWT